MRVLLTGFMGAGKTTAGRRLAERLELPFFDLDEVIAETAGKSVRDIFASEGETAFRRRERLALEQVLEAPRVVVATGGGTLVEQENAALARKRAVTVWLDPPQEVIEDRLSGNRRQDRPLYGEPSEMRALRQHRLPAYRKADLHLEISGEESVDDVVSRLLAMLEEFRCATW